MKKLTAALAVTLLGTMLSTTVFAAGNLDVWDKQEQSDEATLAVSIQTNGKATDGITEINYSKEMLSVEEDDVKISGSVDMYSINLEEESVKIAYLAEQPMEEGTFITIGFTVAEEYLGKPVSVEVITEAHDGDGNSLETGVQETPGTPDNSETPNPPENSETPDNSETPEKPEKPEGGNGGNQNSNASVSSNETSAAKSAQTNDTANLVPAILLLSAGLLVIASELRKRKAH